MIPPPQFSAIARMLAAMRHRLQGVFPCRVAKGVPHFAFHPDYCGDQATGPYDLMRPYRILHYLEKQGLLCRGQLHRPRPASLNRLRLVHTRSYLESLEDPEALAPIVGFTMPQDLHEQFLAGSRAMVGGTVRATKLALTHGGVAVNLGGGFHHASADRGHGFSCFNDVAIAVRTFRDHGFEDPVLVIDLDIHDGDGTRSIFADDETVHTFSLHNRTLLEIFATSDTCLELGPDIDNRAFTAALRRHLPPVLQAVRPGLVFYLAGSDPHRRDSLGNWRMSHDGLVARDRIVLKMVNDMVEKPPVVMLLAGGYGRHAWRHPAATFSWLLTGDPTIQPPLDLELPLGLFRRLEPLFSRPDTTTQDEGDDWALTTEEILGLDGATGTLFLNAIPHHGLEVVLEKSGLLDRLRAKGFRKLQVETNLSDPTGHLLRVLDMAAPEPVPLIELKLRRDPTTAPPYALLSVEWLLLQNAGHAFVLDQPQLSGQNYPGLGLLRDITAMLVVMCERLELDGLSFRPAHFHMAETSRYVAVFWDPCQMARHEAAHRAMAGLRLSEMDQTIISGRLREIETDRPYAFESACMVVPVSDRLREGPEMVDYRERMARCETPEFKLVEGDD